MYAHLTVNSEIENLVLSGLRWTNLWNCSENEEKHTSKQDMSTLRSIALKAFQLAACCTLRWTNRWRRLTQHLGPTTVRKRKNAAREEFVNARTAKGALTTHS